MALAEGGQSKTEKATPKKRRDERKEGNVFQSSDVVNVLFVFIAFYSLQLLFPHMYDQVSNLFYTFINLAGTTDTLSESVTAEYALLFAKTVALSVLPIALICMSVSVIAHAVQTKFLFVAKNFYFKFSRLSPLQGIKKIFSLKNAVELIKNILKVIILAFIVYSLLSGYIIDVQRTMNMDISVALSFIFSMVMSLIFRVTLIFAFIAFFDYLFQRWEYERKIRMSKQEIKEEYKQMEGNPEIKGKIREIQRQRARSRMMQAVPSADVIIRNPTHFAVALKYDTEKSAAPIVVAKGQDELALRIIAVGEEHEIAIVENRELARGLYANTELEREIPQEYYGAVAEILVYVYKLNNKMR